MENEMNLTGSHILLIATINDKVAAIAAPSDQETLQDARDKMALAGKGVKNFRVYYMVFEDVAHMIDHIDAIMHEYSQYGVLLIVDSDSTLTKALAATNETRPPVH